MLKRRPLNILGFLAVIAAGYAPGCVGGQSGDPGMAPQSGSAGVPAPLCYTYSYPSPAMNQVCVDKIASRVSEMKKRLDPLVQLPAFDSTQCELVPYYPPSGLVPAVPSRPACVCQSKIDARETTGMRGISSAGWQIGPAPDSSTGNAADNFSSCTVSDRLGRCLYDVQAFVGCTVGDAESCAAACQTVKAGIETDAKGHDVELLFSGCHGGCTGVYRIDGQCFVSTSEYGPGISSHAPPVGPVDCSLGEEAILAKYAPYQPNGSGGAYPQEQVGSGGAALAGGSSAAGGAGFAGAH